MILRIKVIGLHTVLPFPPTKKWLILEFPVIVANAVIKMRSEDTLKLMLVFQSSGVEKW